MAYLKNKEIVAGGITYNSLHWWIRRHWGRADKCENNRCSRESGKYQWALIKGKKYEKKRSNFKMLCRKCHFNYDLREFQKEKFNKGRLLAQKARIGSHHTEESKLKMSKNRKGVPAWNKGKAWSEETKKKMSLAKIGRTPWNKGLKKVTI